MNSFTFSPVSPASAKAVGQKVQAKESSSEEKDDSDEDDSGEEEEAPKSLKQLPQQKKQGWGVAECHYNYFTFV